MSGRSQYGHRNMEASALVQQPRAVGAALPLVSPLLGWKWPRFSVTVHEIATQRVSCPPRRGVHDNGRHVILLGCGDPRHQHDVAWGWAEALMMIRSGTLRRSDRVRLATLYRADPITTAERQTDDCANHQRTLARSGTVRSSGFTATTETSLTVARDYSAPHPTDGAAHL
jgi:hypothetical protein